MDNRDERLRSIQREVVRTEAALLTAQRVNDGKYRPFDVSLDKTLADGVRSVANARFLLGEFREELGQEERAARSLLPGWPG